MRAQRRTAGTAAPGAARVLTGLEAFVAAPPRSLAKARLGLLCNQASVDRRYRHARDLLARSAGRRLAALFSPQHGVFGEKQDNMVESAHGRDPALGIPVFSLYADVRRPTAAMLAGIDALLVDLQDVGCRVYTFITTLRYCLEEAARLGKKVVVLDRPNPIGGAVEGNLLEPALLSFVGAHPLPMRHGLTMGELARLFVAEGRIDADLEVVPLRGWRRRMLFAGTGLPWVPPSPNMPTPDTALVYPGQVLLEGTLLSEGRGTTRPFEVCGAPWVDPVAALRRAAPAPAPRGALPGGLVPADLPEVGREGLRRAAAPRHRPRGLPAVPDDAGAARRDPAPLARTPTSGASRPTSTRRSGCRSTCSRATRACARGWTPAGPSRRWSGAGRANWQRSRTARRTSTCTDPSRARLPSPGAKPPRSPFPKGGGMRGTAITHSPLWQRGIKGVSSPYLPNIPFFRPPSTGFSPSQTDQSARMKSAPSITPRAFPLIATSVPRPDVRQLDPLVLVHVLSNQAEKRSRRSVSCRCPAPAFAAKPSRQASRIFSASTLECTKCSTVRLGSSAAIAAAASAVGVAR